MKITDKQRLEAVFDRLESRSRWDWLMDYLVDENHKHAMRQALDILIRAERRGRKA